MKLASFEHARGESYGIITPKGVIDAGLRFVGRFPDLLSVIAAGAIEELRSLAASAKPDYSLGEIRLRKPIPRPGKILCVGVNYADRNAEYKDSSEQPKYPSLFVRFPDSLVAHDESLVRPSESEQLDYEGEIALVIGRRGRRISEAEAMSHVLGFTICNEGSIRDWIRHGKFNVTPGKNFEQSGALGPWIATSDELQHGPLRILTRVNGELRQDDTTEHMLFSMPYLISYISRFCSLQPGDVIATGTPTGAGARFNPPKYLVPCDVVEVEVPGIGTLRNRVIDEEI